MMKVIFVILLVFCAGCSEDGKDFLGFLETRHDQCLRRELFKECMTLTSVKSESCCTFRDLIQKCRDYSGDGSIRLMKNIKLECF